MLSRHSGKRAQPCCRYHSQAALADPSAHPAIEETLNELAFKPGDLSTIAQLVAQPEFFVNRRAVKRILNHPDRAERRTAGSDWDQVLYFAKMRLI